MHLLRLRCRATEKDLLVAELHELGTLGVLETELPDFVFELEAWFERPFDAGELARHQPAWQPEPERDWLAESRRQWQPLAVGRRLYLVPDWLDHPAPEGRLRLVVHPGEAPGSGYSEPTQLALEALETHLRPGDTVLDVGAGSGILTAAAALLGATKLYACDIDPAVAATAAANLRRDRIAARLFAGSPRSLRTGSASLVVANLNAATLLSLAGELVRVVTADGLLVLSGFRHRRLGEIRRAFELRGMPVRQETARGDWRCLVAGDAALRR
jgi:ribosomal protein L11 methyltransferase